MELGVVGGGGDAIDSTEGGGIGRGDDEEATEEAGVAYCAISLI